MILEKVKHLGIMLNNKADIKILLILLVCLPNIGEAQNIDSIAVNKLLNQHILLYKDDKGNLIGDKPMEATSIRVVFYTFSLNRAKRKLLVEGRIFYPYHSKDSTGEINYIFLATPVNNRLTKLRILKPSYQRLLNDQHDDIFPFRTGDFRREFTFNNKERLYFNGEMTFPVEYNIGELLE